MSRALYLIRHAKSSWENSEGLADINRPLELRGVNDAIAMGRYFLKEGIYFDQVISSNGIRALHTATIMAKEMQTDFSRLSINPILYHASLNDFFEAIQAVDESVENLAIYSHNPGISEFAIKSGADILDVATNGVLHYKVKADSWSALSFKDLAFFSFIKPKDLR